MVAPVRRAASASAGKGQESGVRSQESEARSQEPRVQRGKCIVVRKTCRRNGVLFRRARSRPSVQRSAFS